MDESLCRRVAYGVDDERLHWTERLAAWLRYRLRLPAHYSFRRMRNVPNTNWMNTAKHLDPAEARDLLRGIEGTAARCGDGGPALRIDLARERGDYRIPYQGQALTVSAEA